MYVCIETVTDRQMVKESTKRRVYQAQDRSTFRKLCKHINNYDAVEKEKKKKYGIAHENRFGIPQLSLSLV